MRTLVSTLLVGATLVAGPALAQQHPWVPSSVNASTASLPNGEPTETHHPWVSSNVYQGTLPSGDALARADSRPRHHTGTQRSSADK